MKQFRKPEYHFVRKDVKLDGGKIAELSDEELKEYFNGDSFREEKKKYIIKRGFVLREIAGEYAIVPVDAESVISNAVMAPNETAVFLWKAFERPSTIEDVVKQAMVKYDVSPEVIRNSIERFINETQKYGILGEV